MKSKITTESGFTLIELLVVISIIGLLASVVMYAVVAARTKARDTVRKSTIVVLSKVVEQYYVDNNSYPSTGGLWYLSEPDSCGVGCPYISNPGSYIPGVVPTYIAELPHDLTANYGGSNPSLAPVKAV